VAVRAMRCPPKGQCPDLAAPRVSVVVPAYNSARELPDCLSALICSTPAALEVIVVDDASTDDTAAVAAGFGVTVVRLARNCGPGGARNAGGRTACGDILFFVDADVVVAPDAIERVVRTFEGEPDLAAVFGSYDSRPRAPGVVSQYRNLLHHFVHQAGRPEARTFWGACGAIRRSVFLSVGGFDAERYPQPSIEDIELGDRLRAAGHRLRLDRQLQGTHLKQWRLLTVIRTDIACRAVPWARLILSSGSVPDDLNLKLDQRVSSGLVGLAGVLTALSPLRLELLGLAAAALAGMVVVNRRLFLFLLRERGLGFALACVPLHVLYYLCCGLGFGYVWVRSLLAPARRDGDRRQPRQSDEIR
jgi:glycosyltransferase involved in cell wall biosynthesis